MKSLKGIKFKSFNKCTGVPGMKRRSGHLARTQSKGWKNYLRTFQQQDSIILNSKDVFCCYNVSSNTMVLNSDRQFYRDPLLKYNICLWEYS